MGFYARILIRKVIINNGGIMKKVIITLEFEKEEVDQEDVIQYLQELIEQNCLS